MDSRMATGMTAPDQATSAAKRPRPARWIALVGGVDMIGLVVALATRNPASERVANSPLLGRAAPAIEGKTIDGEAFNLVDLKGQWVLVNYFATWCVPCRKEHPELVRFSQRQRGQVAVIGVIYSDSTKAVRSFRDKEGGEWPMVADPTGRTALEWGVSGVPESFLVDPTGIVRARILGGVTVDGLERLLLDAKFG